MTPAEIDALPAGRELDALVAERVMGKQIVRGCDPGGNPEVYEIQPCGHIAPCCCIGGPLETPCSPYSTSIAAAWEVVEKLRGDGYPLAVLPDPDSGGWIVASGRAMEITRLVCAKAETTPLAVCHAALKVVRAHA